MSWVRLDDAFPAHRKVRRLSDAAFRMHVSALCWSSKYLTDGHISAEDVQMVADLDDYQDPQVYPSVTKELVQRGLWHEGDHDCESCPTAGDGWVIHDFLDLNPSAEHVQHQRRLATERQRRSRASRGNEETDDDANGHGDVTRDSRVGHASRHAPVTVPHSHSHSQSPTPKKTSSKTPFDVAEFDNFWSAYPKKVAKGGAIKAWGSARKKASAEDIAAGAARYSAAVSSTEVRFICTPAKWLNDERWTDEAAPARPTNGNRATTNGWDGPFLNPTDPNAYDEYQLHGKPGDDELS